MTGNAGEEINYPLIGDGFCHDEINNAGCNYDGGDCCGSCVVTSYCSECDCHSNLTNNGATNPLVGDGFCRDDTNNLECNYDHGDCCLFNANRDSCSDCACSGNGFITSPGFPKNYDKNLNLTWLIQLPLGQNIKIVFIKFDIHLFFECQ